MIPVISDIKCLSPYLVYFLAFCFSWKGWKCTKPFGTNKGMQPICTDVQQVVFPITGRNMHITCSGYLLPENEYLVVWHAIPFLYFTRFLIMKTFYVTNSLKTVLKWILFGVMEALSHSCLEGNQLAGIWPGFLVCVLCLSFFVLYKRRQFYFLYSWSIPCFHLF